MAKCLLHGSPKDTSKIDTVNDEEIKGENQDNKKDIENGNVVLTTNMDVHYGTGDFKQDQN